MLKQLASLKQSKKTKDPSSDRRAEHGPDNELRGAHAKPLHHPESARAKSREKQNVQAAGIAKNEPKKQKHSSRNEDSRTEEGPDSELKGTHVPILRSDRKILAKSTQSDDELIRATEAGNHNQVELLLASANIEATNQQGATPLCIACEQGYTRIVTILLHHTTPTADTEGHYLMDEHH